jgi:cell division initiation protein
MRMTPLDVQSHVFRRRFSGFDPTEVESFLRMVAEDYESMVRENEGQRERIHRLESRVEDLVASETLLRETLVTAQAMSEELRRTAARESEVMLGEAEVRAEKILDASHRRASQLAEDIREMRSLRTRLAASIRSAIENQLSMLDSLQEDREAEAPLEDGKVTFLSRSKEPAQTVVPPERTGSLE